MATVITGVVAGSAWAGPALDEEGKAPAATTDPTLASTQPTEETVEYGAAFRLRRVHVPQAILELFVERAAGGAANTGLGFELLRRRGTVELQLGFEFEHLTVGEGVWINRGENVAAGDESDYILSPEHAPGAEKLGWFTIEFTFMNHSVINKNFAIRYGGGAGLGIITGSLYHYNIICVGATNENVTPGCVPPRFSGTGQYSEGSQTEVKYDLPPVFPVVNAILGVQIKPIRKLVINIEGGIRTTPFFGTSVGYYF